MAAVSLKRRAMAVLWPSFLMAGVLEMLVFAMVDPATLRWFGGELVRLSPRAVYSLSFLLFWAVIAGAGALTALLLASAREINQTEVGAHDPL